MLAFLRWQPVYGYMLAQQFESVFPAWNVSPQALYDALARLERKGLIEPVPEDARRISSRCERTPYRLTEQGQEELRWFLERLDLLDVPREYFVLAVRIASWNGSDALLDLLDQLEQRVTERLDALRAPRRPERLNQLGDWLFVKDQQHHLQGRLSWIQDAREAALDLIALEGAR
ncbi:MAG TPA: PadR family transcriptional regulator [Conexibacter sp.]|nr:PadR family transcriptional regulator [Conexibacter sp.]